jgi:serine protease inhibitor
MPLHHQNYRAVISCALLLTLTAMSGCGGGSMNAAMNPSPSSPGSTDASAPPAVLQAKAAGTQVSSNLVNADNTFGLNLFQLLDSGATENVAISPISIAMALQILYNGAAGTTQTAMQQTLQLGSFGSVADLNNANAALQASLMDADSEVQLTVANSLWMHLMSNTVLPSFTQTDQNYYGAMVGDLAGAPGDVNTWVSNETNGLITDILPAGDYSSVIAVIANAIYFKGQWTTAFDPTQTAAAPFTLSDGTQTTAQMMHQAGSYDYFEGSNFQAIRLPYGHGRFSMFIVLPNSGTTLASLVGTLDVSTLNSWIGAATSANGSIALPRFSSTYGVSLPQALSTLGMGVALCSSNSANFSALAQGVCVSDVSHKTVVEVDESGTVAAGATTITVVPTAVARPAFTMTVDHPFFYAIRDDLTGELLFVGALLNPS